VVGDGFVAVCQESPFSGFTVITKPMFSACVYTNFSRNLAENS